MNQRTVPVSPDGSIYLEIDEPRVTSAGDAYAIRPPDYPAGVDFTGRRVHLMSRFACGEIRAYFVIDRVVHRDFPTTSYHEWAEMDAAVLGALVGAGVADHACWPEAETVWRRLGAGWTLLFAADAADVAAVDALAAEWASLANGAEP